MKDEKACVHKNVEIVTLDKGLKAERNILRCNDCKAELHFCDDCAFRVAAAKLAGCVIFALKFAKHLGRGGMMVDLATMKPTGRWEDRFFDALDLIGYTVDRKAFFNPKMKRKGKGNAKNRADTQRKETGARSPRRSRTTRTQGAQARVNARR